MIENDVEITCPFGSDCSGIKDNRQFRCRLYVKIVGTDAQGNDRDEYDCAISWQPVLMVEQIRGLSGVQAATESARNGTMAGLHAVAQSVDSASKGMNVLEAK